MTDLRISDVATRTGFSTTTLRYYEQIGLVAPAGRSASGYRLYDERSVERLAFVGRAKALGLSLEEITELAAVWEGDRCAPVQDRLRALVAAKRDDIRARIAELERLATELDGVAGQLGTHTPDGPCDDACGCVSDPAAAIAGTAPAGAAPTPVALTRRPTAGRAPATAVPIACTLPAREVTSRIDDWRAVLTEATGRVAIPGGVRLAFPPSPELTARLAALAAAEQACCAFLSFSLEITAGGTLLDIGAPPEAIVVVTSLVGVAP